MIRELIQDEFFIKKVLVIAPKNVAENVWAQETRKWDELRGLRCSVISGTEKKRVKALNTPADIYVIGRDNVVWLYDHYGKDWPFDALVIDELSS